jgi:hypothetical protein
MQYKRGYEIRKAQNGFGTVTKEVEYYSVIKPHLESINLHNFALYNPNCMTWEIFTVG